MLFVKLLIALAICLQLPVIALAHPGRTDSSGGHTDHDSGEYHYHHGYPAHGHYDMDGDGTVDCPYKFDDKTGSSSNETKSFHDELEEELEKLRKEKQNSTQLSASENTPASGKTTKTFWDKIPENLLVIMIPIGFYSIFLIPGLISMAYKKLFKKK